MPEHLALDSLTFLKWMRDERSVPGGKVVSTSQLVRWLRDGAVETSGEFESPRRRLGLKDWVIFPNEGEGELLVVFFPSSEGRGTTGGFFFGGYVDEAS